MPDEPGSPTPDDPTPADLATTPPPGLPPVHAGVGDRWDAEVDVVVVGLGAAGAAAALAAAAAGAEVLVLERTGAGGGTSASSGGILYLGGGTATQLGAGFDDDPDAMRAFLAEALGRPADDPRLRAYCDGSVGHHDWLVARGVAFEPAFWPEPGMEPPGTEGLVFTGGEDTAPYADHHRPVPRGHVPATPNAAGGHLMERLLTAVAGAGVGVRTDARVRSLVVADGAPGDGAAGDGAAGDGAVTGVVAAVDGAEVRIRARGGVVLACGGWAYDDELVGRYAPALLRAAWRLGTDADDGWGLRACTGLGAAVEGMTTAEVALPITPPRSMVRGVLVNGAGERFINEDTYFGHVGQAALVGQAGEVFLVVDEPRYEVNRVGMRATWVCADWDELGDEIGLPPGALAATMAAYNAAADRGEDPAFGKGADWLVPLTEPPFGAFDLRPDATIYAGFPLGGVCTDVDGRVLRPDGSTVAGLHAVGRVAASLALARYCSGISLGEGTFFGRRAGDAAAAAAARAG